MNSDQRHLLLSCLITLITIATVCGQAPKAQKKKPVLNVAKKEIHPFADPKGGRENYSLSGEKVNEFRLYEFYQRQADYYMVGSPGDEPEILPAFPGLDGGEHGHWGKYNQNRHEDGRWNDIEFGEVLTQVFRGGDMVVLKGVCVQLGENRGLSTVFDPMTLNYRSVWEEGFVTFTPFRWGASGNAHMEGKPWYRAKNATMPERGKYLGYSRYGKRVVFEYLLGGVKIEDEPWADPSGFYRRLDIKQGSKSLSLPIASGEGLDVEVVSKRKVESASIKDGVLEIKNSRRNASVIVRISKLGTGKESNEILEHLNSPRVISSRWVDVLRPSGSKGQPIDGSGYVVDTIHVPYSNPYNAVMQLTGIAFMPDGDALVCTLSGDMWRVSGMDDSLKNVTWRRFATGFNQPVGIHIDDDGIFVLDRGQIYRLHDRNDDGEVDFYENYANDFGGYDRSHTHTFGLHRTADGAFHFTQRESILRTGLDRKTELQGWGVRNCMGIGGSDDYFWVAPQEGTWTPASAIIEVNNSEFYGLPTKAGKAGTIAAPLCFLPRGVDNSTGGMLEINSDLWGPFKGSHVGLSYGAGLHYIILRDETGARPQGAIVPLDGNFLAGAIRGAFHPKDGQLYLVGLDGWGDYSVKDGCFHRVRYTGEAVLKPSGFRVHSNGIRIDFPSELDASAAENVEGFFAQQWNYEYAKRYGSPEFSAKNPSSLGHDRIFVRSVTLLESGKSIFVEMPSLEPVMQVHIRMHLRTKEGDPFKTDLFASPMYPGEHFQGDNLADPEAGKLTAISLRVLMPTKEDEVARESGEVLEGEKELFVEAGGGLQFLRKTLEVRAGEPVALRLKNTDVMPHNLVIVARGGAEKVGMASFRMLNDPAAGRKHYVPDLPEVLAWVPVINPGTDHVLHFRAPQEPGDYPYLCTFPGHWQAMRGVLKVR
ncbi:plastocyanin/azurin family copper-binding protein [bacterium]|nr:plastocyanin/azurin family copper-binding protein [bacterium]